MKWKPYPRYKDSGVEWLGHIPEHWGLKRLGQFFSERREKVSDKDYPPLSVTKAGVVPQLETAAKSDDGDNRKRVHAGDFVINGRSDRKGSSGLSGLDGSVSLINIVLQPHDEIVGEFVHHVLKSYPFQEEFYRYGKGIVADLWSTNYSEMRSILLGVPGPHEQSAIANFLDRATAKLDTLIAKQERLIKLLQEKRHALISHAVTKGLSRLRHSGESRNPEGAMDPGFRRGDDAGVRRGDDAGGFRRGDDTRDFRRGDDAGGRRGNYVGVREGDDRGVCLGDEGVPMKDSGVEWLGEVPAHWNVTRLKYAAERIVDCPHETPEHSPDGECCVVRTADLAPGVLDLSGAYLVNEDEYMRRIRRSEIEPNDILYGRVGERWGFAALAPEDRPVCLGQRMIQLRAGPLFSPQFLMWQINADSTYRQGQVDTVGATSLHENVETIRNYWLSQPPLAEQIQIANALDQSLGQIDALIAKSRRSIDLLREHRSALISAAVTGKIDVREAA